MLLLSPTVWQLMSIICNTEQQGQDGNVGDGGGMQSQSREEQVKEATREASMAPIHYSPKERQALGRTVTHPIQ